MMHLCRVPATLWCQPLGLWPGHCFRWLTLLRQRLRHDGLCAAGGQDGGLAGFTAEQVEEVHAVVRMLPIFFTTVLYWTIYAQV